MRYAYLIAIVLGIFVLTWAGLRGTPFELTPWEVFPDMDRQYKVKYQQPSDFFANGVASRLPVDGTVPMGYAIPAKAAAQGGGVAGYGFTQSQDYFNSGRFGDFFGDGLPGEIEVDEAFLARGKERYEINCQVCHGATGNGKGALSNYWPAPIANLNDPRLGDRAQTPDGALYHTITYGKSLMGPYGANITVRDRWAIVAYLRVLQKTKAGALVTPAPTE